MTARVAVGSSAWRRLSQCGKHPLPPGCTCAYITLTADAERLWRTWEGMTRGALKAFRAADAA